MAETRSSPLSSSSLPSTDGTPRFEVALAPISFLLRGAVPSRGRRVLPWRGLNGVRRRQRLVPGRGLCHRRRDELLQPVAEGSIAGHSMAAVPWVVRRSLKARSEPPACGVRYPLVLQTIHVQRGQLRGWRRTGASPLDSELPSNRAAKAPSLGTKPLIRMAKRKAGVGAG